MKKKLIMRLNIFEGNGGDGGAGGGTGGSGSGGQGGNTGGSYTYEQAEEIANSRAQRAERSALADFFRKQGLNETEVTEAINDFKAKQAANRPNADAIAKERDAYKAEIEQMKNEKILIGKGVKQDDLEFVMFKVSKMVDEKTDFEKAAEKFLKENVRFTPASGYRVTSSVSSGEKGSGGSINSSINDAIRNAARR